LFLFLVVARHPISTRRAKLGHHSARDRRGFIDGQYRFSALPRPADSSGPPIPVPFEPLDHVSSAPERYPLFHVKVGAHATAVGDGYHVTDVGDGDIDYQGFATSLQQVDLAPWMAQPPRGTRRRGECDRQSGRFFQHSSAQL
jgi:hypothetical protein